MEVYNQRAPEWWDFAEWDFSVQTEESGDEASLTEGEADLQFLVDGELEEESADDAISWGEDLSPTEDEAEADSEDKTSSDEYPPTKRFRAGSWDDSDDDDDAEDEDEEEVPADRYRSDDEHLLGSADEGDDGDDERTGSEDEDSSGSSSDSEEESSSDEDGSDGDDAGDGSDGEGSAVC
jgi:hypothetical protein